MEISCHIRLLGTVQLEVTAEPIRNFASRKSKAFLGYLIRQEGPVSRSHLADLFWTDNSESRGQRNLSHELSLLAKKLPGCFQADYPPFNFSQQFMCPHPEAAPQLAARLFAEAGQG